MTKAVIGQVPKRYTILTFALYSSTYDRLDQFSKMSVDNTTSPAAIPSPPATLASIPSEDIVARKVRTINPFHPIQAAVYLLIRDASPF